MTTTNELHMPQAFVNFVSNVRHNAPGTLSATTLRLSSSMFRATTASRKSPPTAKLTVIL